MCSDVCSLGAEYKRERTKKISPFLRKRPRGKDLSLLSVCSEALFGLELDVYQDAGFKDRPE